MTYNTQDWPALPPLSALVNRVHCMDALELLALLPDGCVNTIVTSPPYYNLRNYGMAGQIGLEESPKVYVDALVKVFREARRVLRDDGTLWVNLGDTYAGGDSLGRKDAGRNFTGGGGNKLGSGNPGVQGQRSKVTGLKPKDLIGIPWRVAFALQDDGWYLRSDIIWHKCLSGGTHVYARTQKGEMPMMMRDAARLDPSTVQLWNGEKWTQVVTWERLQRKGTEIELVLRSGERISCTPEHRFPTGRGLVNAGDLTVGDVLQSVCLPEPVQPYNPPIITEDAAWFLGMYLAEGSRSGSTIQIAGHIKEQPRLQRIQEIAAHYGGSVTYTESGNNLNIRVYGRFLNALIDQYISGKTAKDKGLKVRCWSHSNDWLRSLLQGYLEGDGHWDEANGRWRLGFTRNYNLERDLRVLCARLGLRLILKLSTTTVDGRKFDTFRGEIRFVNSSHHNVKVQTEIVAIRKSRCREVYDVAVEDDPHLFALASGVLTHNSNPMPESVTDRPTKSHEYIFLLSKSERYYYDHEAIKEPAVDGDPHQPRGSQANDRLNGGLRKQDAVGNPRYTGFNDRYKPVKNRNKRTVWTVSTKPFSEAHFATYPLDLIEPCILAGAPVGGVVYDPFMGAGTTALAALKNDRQYIGSELNPAYVAIAEKRLRDCDPMQAVEVAPGVVQASLFAAVPP